MITAWIVVTVVSKSATSALIETFIADWSSTMTNWAMAKATSGNQFVFGAGLVCVSGDSPAVTGTPFCLARQGCPIPAAHVATGRDPSSDARATE